MIVKFPKSKKETRTISGLIKYIVNSKKTIPDLGKKASIKKFNLPSLNTKDTIGWIKSTARQLPTAKKPMEHIILSWKEFERPSEDEMFKAVEMFLEKMGWDKNEAVAAIHYDKLEESGLHLHIAVNKVVYDPVKNKIRSINPSFKHNEAHKAAREIEVELGFSHDNGNFVVAFDHLGEKRVIKNPHKKITKSANSTYEVQTGSQSFKSFLSTTIRDKLTKLLKNNEINNWEDFHSEVATYNLKFEIDGGGLKVIDWNLDESKRVYGKASDIGKFFSKSKLEKKFGDFVESTIDYESNNPAEKYNPKVLADRHNVKGIPKAKLNQLEERIQLTKRKSRVLDRQEERVALYNAYHKKMDQIKTQELQPLNNKRNAVSEEKRQVLKVFNSNRRKELKLKVDQAKLNCAQNDEIELIKTKHRLETLRIKDDLNQQFKERYIQIKKKRAEIKRLSFLEYCYEIQKNPDHKHHAAAKGILRGQRIRLGKEKYDSLKNSEIDFNFKPIVISDFSQDADNQGVFKGLDYQFVQDKGIEFKRDRTTVFVDSGKRISFNHKVSADDYEAGLLLAAEKFNNRVEVHGSDEYKDKMCQIAAKHHHIKLIGKDLQIKVEKYKINQRKKYNNDNSLGF